MGHFAVTLACAGFMGRSTRLPALRAAPTASLVPVEALVEATAPVLQSVSDAEQLAGPLFGGSLFPYIAFLYFLRQADAPANVQLGFGYLLVFVFLSIPAAISSKVLFAASLADCDWLHGSAESLLSITNLLTVVALKQALRSEGTGPADRVSWPMAGAACILGAGAVASAAVPAAGGAAQHARYLGGFMDLDLGLALAGAGGEPANALSVACWVVHVSSLLEWLAAMQLVWFVAERERVPAYKGLTWAMLPLHTSGLIACTYHLFYNRPDVALLLPFQAGCTLVGNCCVAYAAYRIAAQKEQLRTVGDPAEAPSAPSPDSPQDVASRTTFPDDVLGDGQLAQLLIASIVGAYIVKYGELVALPFFAEGGLDRALPFVVVPTMLNVFKWWTRGQEAQQQSS